MSPLLRPALLAVVAAGLVAPSVANADFMHFTTPSRTIDCVAAFDSTSVDCVVQRASWPRVPPRPPDCDLDWVGTQISLSRGRVSLGSCRGDVGPQCFPQSGDCPALPYGTSLTLPSKVRCTSRRSALTCRARKGAGAGFTVSRQGYRIHR
jgi:hypothetical protein